MPALIYFFNLPLLIHKQAVVDQLQSQTKEGKDDMVVEEINETVAKHIVSNLLQSPEYGP